LQRWEYLVGQTTWTEGHSGVFLPSELDPDPFGPDLQISTVLANLGEQGWELVGIDHSAPSGALYIFERPADAEAP
jgi:hypothetical protein